MTGTTIRLRGAEGAAQRGASRERRLGWPRLRARHAWLVPGLAIALVANQLGTANGVGIVAMIAFGIAPDIPRLLGSRGRPFHDVLHHPVPPVAAAIVTATGLVGVVWLVAALVWLGHVVIGRAVGDVPRPGRSDARA